MKKIFISIICFLILSNICLAETVSFNVNSHKIHNSSCRYYNCKNCVKMERQKALKKGAKPCKVCGG